ncbi:MAG: FliI/YscN family ATPase [Janthinobacterium lividum]
MQYAAVNRRLTNATAQLKRVGTPVAHGHVTAASGMTVEISGLDGFLTIGDRLTMQGRDAAPALAEVIGFQAGRLRVMPLGALTGIGPGTTASLPLDHGETGLPVCDEWLGRVIDALGAPLDNKGALPSGPPRKLRAPPPPAASRARLGPRISLGVRALDLFTTCRAGQRLGLFAGSGVGKSTLLAMLAQQAQCDVVVLALVGERGREVREFIEDDLGPALARSVVVVATSDQPPLLRREAAYAAMTVAEYFRDQGRSVLLLMDSVTRFCLALREIGLAAGEPPATRGYPPSMFAELPCLLERAGPGTGAGSITGLFTVLVEGDDHNEPIADAVRGILDGHAVLDRKIAESGRYPAIDLLRSLSRTATACLDPAQNALIRKARAILSTQAELADLVRLGAYQQGADPAADDALLRAPQIEAFLQQHRSEPPNDDILHGDAVASAFAALASLIGNDHVV